MILAYGIGVQLRWHCAHVTTVLQESNQWSSRGNVEPLQQYTPSAHLLQPMVRAFTQFLLPTWPDFSHPGTLFLVRYSMTPAFLTGSIRRWRCPASHSPRVHHGRSNLWARMSRTKHAQSPYLVPKFTLVCCSRHHPIGEPHSVAIHRLQCLPKTCILGDK